MQQDDLIEAIRLVVDDGVRLRTIEKQLKMPLNTLSGILNKKRPFPPKWEKPLMAYVLKDFQDSLDKKYKAIQKLYPDPS